jgi:D-glycero-alpha-D-manno-heptose-7-phosphate kinase
MVKTIRSKAPLRLGLAGGGTDTSPYSDIYGGEVLNATINLFAYATIETRRDGKILFQAMDRGQIIELPAVNALEIDGELSLLKGIYNRIVSEFTKKPLSFTLTTYVDAPPGSGLGSSSTLVVAVLGAFVEWLKLPLGEYDIAHLAYEIERLDLQMAGGKQDQYAATFGGINYMEFYDGNNVIVNPLRIKQEYICELEFNVLLYYTGTSRLSSAIIDAQTRNIKEKRNISLDAMHKLKEQSRLMKECILKGKINEIGEILDFGWKYKKQLTREITNPVIEEVYEAAKEGGATGGKISGAGGGGFMILYCPNNARYKVIEKLSHIGGKFKRFQLAKYGLSSWTV